MSGEEARKVFFGSKDLDFAKGYEILLGGVSLIGGPAILSRISERL